VVAYVTGPVLGNFTPATGFKTSNTSVSISGKASAVSGIAHVNWTLDTCSTVNVVTVAANGAFTIGPSGLMNLGVGIHTVHINVIDKNGLKSAKDFTFTVEKKAAKKTNNFPMMWVAVIVIVIILIIIIAAVAMRGGGGSKPEEKKEEPKAGGT
jgi:hypothetical protein